MQADDRPTRPCSGRSTTTQKGTIDIIDDDPRRYAFSNIFEVASSAEPYEKVAVGKNRQYVVEAIRAEGTSEWRTAPARRVRAGHGRRGRDPAAEARTRRRRPDRRARSNALAGEPSGPPMGRVVARRGHMTLLPVGAAYQFHADGRR